MYEMDPISFKEILTLRYDTTLKSTLQELKWEDYKQKEKAENISSFIENSIIDAVSTHKKDLTNSTISLSSGIDSTLIASIIKKNFPDMKIDSISVKFADSFDESPSAKKIADRLELDHHIIKIENFLEELPQAISIVKKPFWDLHWYYIAKEAKTYSNNFFSGDGGDELFGGYTFRYKKYLSLVSSNSSPDEKIRAYLSCHERDWIPEQEQIFGEKSDFQWTQIFSVLEKFFKNDLEILDQVFLADLNGKLRYNMIPLYQKIHEFFDISYLAPILNDRLIKFSTHLDNKIKYNSNTNQGKIPLIQLCKKYGMDDLIIKEKKGFSVNTKNLWKNYGQNICDYYLSDARIVKDGWISKEWINKYKSRNDLDVRYVNKFLGLLALEIWHRLFITKEINEYDKLKF